MSRFTFGVGQDLTRPEAAALQVCSIPCKVPSCCMAQSVQAQATIVHATGLCNLKCMWLPAHALRCLSLWVAA